MDQDRTPWLREHTPGWPEHDEDGGSVHDRWRPMEPFEAPADCDVYPGATALDDLEDAPDGAECARILVRYTVLRVFLLSAAGWLTGPRLRTERRIALEHLMTLPAHDWERRTLERLNSLCRETTTTALIAAAKAAAEAAAKRGHCMGAFAFYRAAFNLSRRRGWWAEAADVARCVSRLARLEEARYSERLWARRARVLERRVQRELQQLQQAESDGDGRRV
jgi:hypothetical protein